MNIISHRGNLNGRIPERENSPEYILEAIEAGYDVEIDLRIKNGELWLGHDKPQYKISLEWLERNSDYLWIHCKDFEALSFMSSQRTSFHFFFHEKESFTLISNGLIWAHCLADADKQCIIPLLSKEDLTVYDFMKHKVCGVCTDYPKLL